MDDQSAIQPTQPSQEHSIFTCQHSLTHRSKSKSTTAILNLKMRRWELGERNLRTFILFMNNRLQRNSMNINRPSQKFQIKENRSERKLKKFKTEQILIKLSRRKFHRTEYLRKRLQVTLSKNFLTWRVKKDKWLWKKDGEFWLKRKKSSLC